MSNNNLFSRSSSSSFRQSSASKIDQLYEISYVPDDSRIPVSEMPLVNPYQIFTKPTSSITKRVKQLIGSAPNKQIKEFVQTSKFDSHQLPASQVEHLVSLSLPSDLPRHCLAQGYTHIHFGAIRLALTFHGRKGLPAYSRIALLDTRVMNLEDTEIIISLDGDWNIKLDEDLAVTNLKASYMMNFRMMNQECVKLDKFDGCTYTRWAEKMKFLLIVLKIYYVLDPELPPIAANPVPEPGKPMDEKKISELEKQRMIRKEDETLCCGHIKSSLSDTLCDLYASVTNPRELWSALEFKYKTHEQDTNKYLVSKYLEFVMVEGKTIMEQVHELQVFVNKLKALSFLSRKLFKWVLS
ncbi:viral movement protein [Tanacetum coccineum]